MGSSRTRKKLDVFSPIARSGARSASVAAPAKLNLSLRVIGRRADGYHLLDSLVVPIALVDHVRLSISSHPTSRVSIRCRPGGAPEGPENLAVRAALLYLSRTVRSAWVDIELIKQVPAGAGLGGGSSDAAATLRLLNTLSPIPVSTSELAAWALEVGADVPFFLCGGSARMRGIGEDIQPLPSPLEPGAGLVVVFPGSLLETRHVYAIYDDLLTTEAPVSKDDRLTVFRGPLLQWLENDLEAAAFQILPVLKVLKRQLCALGARGALMTGSGSAVFGVWDGVEQASAAARAMRTAGVWARATQILDRLPAIQTHDEDDGRSPSW